MAKMVRKARTPIRQDLSGKSDDDGADFRVPATGPAPKPAVAPRLRPRADPTGASAPSKASGNGTAPKLVRPVVSLDERKLSRKQVGQLAKWRGATHGRAVDAYMRGQMEAARKKFGHRSVLAGTPDENLLVGIPLPSLAMEYLLAQDAFLLGMVLQIVGLAGSLKSALLYEIFRWFRKAGGGSHLEEAETKYSPELVRSIVRYARDEVNVVVDRCDSVEEWQQRLTYNIESQQKNLVGTQKDPGPGRTIPICMGVDSVTGKLSVETQEAIIEAGCAGRAFPVEALKITNYMKTVPQLIDGWPFAIVLVNHLKMGRDDQGRDLRRVPGGSGLNFQESFELETHINKRKIESALWDGVQISITCTKSSFGPTHRRIAARLLWWDEDDPATSQTEQHTVWDWHWSTIQLLTTLTGAAAARLKEAGFHIDAPKKSDVENTAWSRNLGMKSAEEAISWSELGEMIHQRPDLMDMLRRCLGIKRRPLLEGDYLKQIEGLREQLP